MRPTRSTPPATPAWQRSSTSLGLGDPVAVSATQGLGTGDLLDLIVERLPDADAAADATRLAVIGRPNVGKSSLVNRLLGEERVIVTPLAGTTRDAIDTRIEFEGRPLTLVDTAGLRRRTKVAGTVDYAQLRSEQAADRAAVAIVVCDASEGVTSEDLRVAEMAMRAKCATVIALNKWDVTRTDLEDAKGRVATKLRQRPRVMAVSAKTGRGLRRLVAEALDLADRARSRIRTPELNRFSPTSNPRGSRRPSAAGGCVSTTWPSSRPSRRASPPGERPRASRATTPSSWRTASDRFGLEGVPLVIDFKTSR